MTAPLPRCQPDINGLPMTEDQINNKAADIIAENVQHSGLTYDSLRKSSIEIGRLWRSVIVGDRSVGDTLAGYELAVLSTSMFLNRADFEAATRAALTQQNLAQHEYIRLLEEAAQRVIKAWEHAHVGNHPLVEALVELRGTLAMSLEDQK